jgi:hypothetical protein
MPTPLFHPDQNPQTYPLYNTPNIKKATVKSGFSRSPRKLLD